ncbi:hypothetical protein VSU19_03615, partial [Verrucomicrobiales bacterium BCK34]|nr:hypothetical protein [Verrucomicrobiales bacterium BCK34]
MSQFSLRGLTTTRPAGRQRTQAANRVGTGIVEKVASNRRIPGPDGKVLHTRYTATKNETIRAFPVGTIDP